MTAWQARAAFNVSRLSHLFEYGADSDVTLIVGSEHRRRFEVHKLVLSMWSEVFREMFYGREARTGEIRIPDVQPEIFNIAMKYIYEENFTVRTIKEAMDTHVLAEKYIFEMLAKRCFRYISDNMSPENMPSLYTMPELLDRLQLRSKCQAVLSEKTLKVLTCNRFLDSPKQMIEDMVKLPQLNIDSEGELFQHVLRWVKSECCRQSIECTAENIRSMMNNFLLHIRFMAMTIQDFYAVIVPTRILSDTEIAEISENIMTPGSRRLPNWCSQERARNSERSFLLIDTHVCRFSDILLSSVECTLRVLNGSMRLMGVSVILHQSEESTTFTVEKDGEIIPSSEIRSSYDHNSNVLKLTLVHPVVLNPSSEYKILVTSCRDIFPICRQVMASPFIRHHNNFELLCRLKDPYHPVSKPSATLLTGYSHLHQIFYS